MEVQTKGAGESLQLPLRCSKSLLCMTRFEALLLCMVAVPGGAAAGVAVVTQSSKAGQHRVNRKAHGLLQPFQHSIAACNGTRRGCCFGAPGNLPYYVIGHNGL